MPVEGAVPLIEDELLPIAELSLDDDELPLIDDEPLEPVGVSPASTRAFSWSAMLSSADELCVLFLCLVLFLVGFFAAVSSVALVPVSADEPVEPLVAPSVVAFDERLLVPLLGELVPGVAPCVLARGAGLAALSVVELESLSDGAVPGGWPVVVVRGCVLLLVWATAGNATSRPAAAKMLANLVIETLLVGRLFAAGIHSPNGGLGSSFRSREERCSQGICSTRAARIRGSSIQIAPALALLLFALCVFASRPAAAVTYTTKFQGVDGELAKAVESASRLKSLEGDQDTEPPTEAALRRRADADLERLERVLRSFGFYDAKLTYRLEPDAGAGAPLGDDVQRSVIVEIEPGEPYRIKSITLTTPDGKRPPLDDRFPAGSFGVAPGDVAAAAPIVAQDDKITRAYQENGYPRARIADRTAIVDHADRSMELTLQLEPGPYALFGPALVGGLERLDPAYVERRVTWVEGAPYDVREIEASREALVDTALFGTVTLTPQEVLANGEAPIAIETTERLRRSVSAGAQWDSTIGISAKATWEHRNLFGGAERLRLTAETGQSLYGLIADYRKPDIFRIKDLDALASVSITRELVDAYDSRRIRLYGGVEYKFSKQLSVGGGAQFERGHVTEKDRTRSYTLVGLPLFLRRDVTDDLLNPTRGDRQQITVTPYLPGVSRLPGFVQAKATASWYRKFDDKGRYIFAVLGAVAGSSGIPLDDLPKDKRFYAGGGGSVRGYGYQKAGDFDRFGDPRGGLSSVELSMEMRVKITDTIGIVPFLDAGRAYPSQFPSFSDLLPGAGIGARYYTPFGPVRLDIAVPLKKRPQDAAFQLYVSLGQAF
ncbi:MAG: outer membrane protein assembly factor [Rhodospirillales bacterium]|nr:outer membrane protein assembly factor [Rhodospirillales bacterium]